HLKKDGAGLEFLLFPMIHVGSKEFYDEVSRRLAACDLILAEGVNSRKAHLLTLSYRIVKKIRRMDLVTQRDGMKISSFRDKIINSDMEGRAFDEHWSALPLGLKAQLFLFLPIYVANLFLFGTREKLAEHMATEDLPSSDEILLQDENFEKLDTLLLDERDQRLISHIQMLYDSHQRDRKIVGVVYGALHMRNVIRFLLSGLNYRVAGAEWVTVFDL
ncbi:MAG: TraB/GumN family protein, partial [Acidobacteria bacterium]|nr:TraB/GumN family protein [Acidobacteriota bacterium]